MISRNFQNCSRYPQVKIAFFQVENFFKKTLPLEWDIDPPLARSAPLGLVASLHCKIAPPPLYVGLVINGIRSMPLVQRLQTRVLSQVFNNFVIFFLLIKNKSKKKIDKIIKACDKTSVWCLLTIKLDYFFY